MKKNIIRGLFIILATILLIPMNVNAATAKITTSSSNKNPTVGSTITVTVKITGTKLGSYEHTISYDSSKLQLTSGSAYNANFAPASTGGNTSSFTDTYKFKVIAQGTSTVSVKSVRVVGYDEINMTTSISGVSITGKTASSGGNNNSNTNYSTNNNLSSLSVAGYTLSPAFNKNTTSYTLNLDSSVENITVNGTKEDSKAQVVGLGTKNISEGDNKIEVIVTSEKGTKKTYTIIVTVKDANPINIDIDGNDLTIIKKASMLPELNTCKASTTTMGDQTIPTLDCEITGFTLVGLKDSESNIDLYIYNEMDNTYTKYVELQSNIQKIIPILATNIPENYKEMTVTINDEKVTAYKLKTDSKYALIYGINSETGDKTWYKYEEDEKTLQKYSDEDEIYYNDKLKEAKQIIYILAGVSGLLAISLLISLITKAKVKTKKPNLDKTFETSFLDEPKKEVIKKDQIKEQETKKDTEVIDLLKEETSPKKKSNKRSSKNS